MRISYFTEKGNLDTSVGYGNAGFQIVRSLQKLGHEVPFNDPTAPVQIAFCNPATAEFHPGQYKIQYTPWESTGLPDGWLEKFNQADEVWATSDWVAKVYQDAGVTVPVRTYLHGLNDIWKAPVKRERGDVLKFLHIGEPAPRKGGQMAFDAFRQVFGDSDDVHLTIKAHHQNYIYSWKDGNIVKLDKFKNVTLNDKHLFEGELLSLYHDHDVLVYPSYGEGFGLIPLQALATGMPVISTYEWAPYAQYLTQVEANPIHTPWFFHPGDVLQPDYDSLMNAYTHLYKNFDEEAEFSYENVDSVVKEFDWVSLTEQAFQHIVERFTEN